MQPRFQIEGVDVFVEGEGAETIVMLHGWPDSWRLWDTTVAHFKSTHRCVRFSLPGYEAGSPRKAYSLDEVAGLIAKVVDRASPGTPVTLLLHDWGCFFGYQYYLRHPHRVSRVVAVDVGDSTTLVKIFSPLEALMVFSYQVWLAAAWVINGRVGDWMTRIMARLLKCETDPSLIGSRTTYPYFLFWTRGYSGKVQPFLPQCPMLYLYAKKKPVMFHDPKWLQAVAAVPHSKVEAFDTGHWVMQNQPAQFNRSIAGWLAGLPA